MKSALADALDKLLRHGDDAPASLFTPSQRAALDALARTSGFIIARPRGRGVAYHIAQRAGLEAHWRTLRPDSLAALAPDLPPRAAHIATHRDSKAGHASHAVHYLLVKAVGSGVSWAHGDARTLDLSAATQSAGAGVLPIQSGDDWQSDCPLWLVENQALFDDTRWLPPHTRASIGYYAGQLPGRLVTWLAQRPRVPEVILFADYDGVGLLNFVRLKEHLTTPCSFWLMPDWPELLRKYGSNSIWLNTHQAFITATTRLATLQAPPELVSLCAAMRQQGLALEHEAVWLAASASNSTD